jgi:hypothetical protein
MSSFDLSSEDVNLSQLDSQDNLSIASSSLASTSRPLFPPRHTSDKIPSDEYIVIENDPVTLARASNILKVNSYIVFAVPKIFQKTIPWICVKPPVKAEQIEYWSIFHEVIHVEKDSAIVFCKHCRTTFEHPKVKTDSSTSTMLKHY